MQKIVATAALLVSTAIAAPVATQADPGEAAFRALYKELVETNTTLSVGDCTKAATQVAARLKAAGFPDSDLHVLVAPEHPREGNLVAVLPGKNPKLKPILMLAHIDVVEAKREDWTRDPFTLIEENGVFYGRGVSDDKAQAAIYSDTMIRLKSQPQLKRTVKLALTCGEESAGALNGAEWLAKNHRALIDAEFAMNEGGGGRLKPDGTPESLSMQVGEKHYQDFIIQTINPGGHSSRPEPANAIYSLASALKSVQGHSFPVVLNDTTRGFFQQMAATTPDPGMAAAMKAIAANPADAAAAAKLSTDPSWSAMLRTTCVATMANAGHAPNALPQRAAANINCRIIPGETVEGTKAALVAAINDPAVTVTALPTRNSVAKQPPMTERVMKPARELGVKHFGKVPFIPTMSTGATDGPFLAAAGIPVYGVPGMLHYAEGSRAHGLNENIPVASVMKGRAYLYNLLKAYANE
ncbi:M20/M25/M40 family metallo-hydrolase [Sandaracinobacteroides hominis]|uniref:M20/M25/M40 family metallo-hydrolase n=1 Tax=Sandaracinobacteroides hominis TaxID=2780086 RepID=UPI0018F59C74|nr:M20/M25/M40 family metallo-hydrolase [Sandaracinobacteroides hominis]